MHTIAIAKNGDDEFISKDTRKGVKMWRLKGCPKCRGDMLVEQDNHGRYEWCLQCGYQQNINNVPGTSRGMGRNLADTPTMDGRLKKTNGPGAATAGIDVLECGLGERISR